MRAQGLPITTIVLIIIAIAVLAGVILLFYFGWFKPQGSVSEQDKISKCQSLCAQIQAHNPQKGDSISSYCKAFYDNNCWNYIICRFTTADDGECYIKSCNNQEKCDVICDKKTYSDVSC